MIELLLKDLALRAGARGTVHWGKATFIDHTFPREQKQALFRLLHDIEERIPWKLSAGKAWRDGGTLSIDSEQ